MHGQQNIKKSILDETNLPTKDSCLKEDQYNKCIPVLHDYVMKFFMILFVGHTKT